MQVNTRVINDVVIIDILGEIDLYNSPKIKEALTEKMSSGFKNVIINLGDVTYIDSSGIGTLIFCRTSLNQNNGALRVIRIKDSVKRIFELTKLNSFFTIFDNESDAISSFK